MLLVTRPSYDEGKNKRNECEISMDFGNLDENGLYQLRDSFPVVPGLLVAVVLIRVWDESLQLLKILDLLFI